MNSTIQKGDYVVRILGTATELWDETLYLEAVDTETDELFFTDNQRHAKRFPTKHEAIYEWRRISNTSPVRRDGKPNRPLSAFTVEISAADASKASD